jgi:predicted phage terminase large subunit-like protein
MGNPESAEGRLYKEFKVWVDPSEYGEYIRSGVYIDVADKGTDDTTAIAYDVYRGPVPVWNEQRNRFEPLLFALVKDCEINPANTDTTRVTVPAMINRQSPAVRRVWCESNSGGDQFGRDISKKIRAQMSLFHQGANKESRIITNAPMVNTQIVMPFDWERRFPSLYYKATHYLAVFKANAHDDVPDVLTGIYEKELAIGNDMNYGKRRGVRRH